MSVAVKEILRASRPPDPPGKVDKYLPDIAQDLRGLVEKSQRGGQEAQRCLRPGHGTVGKAALGVHKCHQVLCVPPAGRSRFPVNRFRPRPP